MITLEYIRKLAKANFSHTHTIQGAEVYTATDSQILAMVLTLAVVDMSVTSVRENESLTEKLKLIQLVLNAANMRITEQQEIINDLTQRLSESQTINMINTTKTAQETAVYEAEMQRKLLTAVEQAEALGRNVTNLSQVNNELRNTCEMHLNIATHREHVISDLKRRISDMFNQVKDF